jgi:two-component system sensor histidine kinase LytS
LEIDLSLIIKTFQNVSVILVIAFATTQLPAFRRMFLSSMSHQKDKIFLAIFFGLFSALGNFMSIPLMNSLANTRIIGVVVGGLLGGPFVGLFAGAIGAVARYFLGGFTMWTAVMANIVIGLFAGMVNRVYGQKRITIKIAFLTALMSELILKTMIVTISKPFEKAWELEKTIAIPTTIANTLGVVLFFYVVREFFNRQEMVQAESAQSAMRVIRLTNGLLRHGLNEQTAKHVAETIYTQTGVAAVAITDLEKMLAYVGKGDDHHIVGAPLCLASTKHVLEQQRMFISNDREAIGCPDKNCPLTAVVDVPLLVEGKLLGSIKIFKSGKEIVTPYEAELVQGIADFLSLQLLQLKLDEQSFLRDQAEYQVLKAQINPHFLYNTLGTIRALVLKKPDTARVLIKNLSDFMRQTLDRTQEITTVAEDLAIVRNYLHIEKARFGERITVIEDIPPEMQDEPIPVFSIQPLVENAIRHGLSPLKEGGTIWISAWSNQDGCFIERSGTMVPGFQKQNCPGCWRMNLHMCPLQGRASA